MMRGRGGPGLLGQYGGRRRLPPCVAMGTIGASLAAGRGGSGVHSVLCVRATCECVCVWVGGVS